MNIGLAILFGTLGMAVLTDLRDRKVPNWLVLVGVLAALAYHALTASTSGLFGASSEAPDLLSALGGIVVGFTALFPLYVLRAMGAGDVKLMMMVGAFLGPLQTLGTVVLTFAAGGVLAIVMTLWQRSFRQLASNLRFMLTTSAARAVGGESPRFEPLQQTAGRMPYAFAIAAGTLLQFLLVRSGGWALS